MPLLITKEELTEINCDAIVVYDKTDQSEQEVVISPKVDKPYNNQVTMPLLTFSEESEKEGLHNLYKKIFSVALENNFESIAIPLIATNAEKEVLLQKTIKPITQFLQFCDLTVYLVVNDGVQYIKNPFYYGVSQILELRNPKPYADFGVMNCILPNEESEGPFYSPCRKIGQDRITGDKNRKRQITNSPYHCFRISKESARDKGNARVEHFEIVKMLQMADDNFAVTLMKLMDKKHMTEVECYKRANVSKQTWYKILNDKNYKPSKNTVIAFAISLKLDYQETQGLLSTVGFTLSNSSEFDIIIRYFIVRKIYDIMIINETLFEFDQPCLGV